ncbi:gamma-glutamylcyclotransferase [Roseibacterium sp. SDUM158017]|uniref:gamma-glutamylcyclotransferase n=1 Tax=Roseicyclus salinarum TaxID=3036773 RepID=UPI002414EA22|nr:gamma-glutamylcyclotransferase [Roseibacterium sp. SDUM158017]MDG4647396.1 gamma-glutamylcyclotransferase [Roseibacterium sp. SDUM158017]
MRPDPFRHHPNLREKVKPFETSFFRTISTAKVCETMTARGIPITFPFHSDETREAIRAEALAGHEGDLLVFAYGSLIWDPALDFAEVRRARAPHHARRFILVDRYGGRGTEAAPGLMAALDDGDGCDGLVFRIEAAKVEAETEILFRREMIGPGYLPRFVPVIADGQEGPALTFLADHDDPMMEPGITRAEQIRYLATGEGFLGTSADYLRNVVSHLHEMAIPDPDLDALLAEAEAEIARA